MMHSLEVLDVMLKNNKFSISRESIIILALFHDLGKATISSKKTGSGMHPSRSIAILNKCGFELREDELSAILNHHPGKNILKMAAALGNPHQLLLHIGDCTSTGINKKGSVYNFSCI